MYGIFRKETFLFFSLLFFGGVISSSSSPLLRHFGGFFFSSSSSFFLWDLRGLTRLEGERFGKGGSMEGGDEREGGVYEKE